MRRTTCAVRAGVAAAGACGGAVRLKWPTTCSWMAGKLGGILVERTGHKCVVGTGHQPALGAAGAALLEGIDATKLVALMEPRDAVVRDDSTVVMATWRAMADTLGRRVRVQLSGETFEASETEGGPRCRRGPPVSAPGT